MADAMSEHTAPEAVFVQDGGAFLPTAHAVSPWGPDKLHGGPVLGLLTRALEATLRREEGWVLARLTFDLFRSAPRSALHPSGVLVRESKRLRLAVASLHAAGTEVARATALCLRSGGASESGTRFAVDPRPAGPEGIETEPLLRGMRRDMPRGFHTSVETRWVPQRPDEPLAIWIRMPMPLVAGEETSGLQRAAALADFCNALASLSARAARRPSPPYINADTTLYLAREPRGEWICLVEERMQEQAGLSLTQTALCDESGCFGRASQARLANG